MAVLASLNQATSIYGRWRGHKQGQGKEQRPERARGKEEPRGQLLGEKDRKQEASKVRPSFLPSSLAHCVERHKIGTKLLTVLTLGVGEKRSPL